jgi:hypothetical protein
VRSELLFSDAVYCGMRLLCVGRHAYLSEHFCRLFGELGADCVPAVGAADALARAATHEPHAIVCDCDLLTPALLDDWAGDRRVAGLPLIAVSLTRRPEELPSMERLGVGGVVYLPSLDRGQLAILLSGANRPRGVKSPLQWRTTSAQQPLPV